jgi:nucleotidyltransferase-like protein
VTEADLIKQALQQLGSHDAIVGVVVFGSLARDELADASDIDVLVVHQASVSAADLRAAVRQSIASEPLLHRLEHVKPIFFTREALLDEMDRHPSFAAHLADEGLVLYRTAEFKPIGRILSSPPITRKALRGELATRLRQLRLFSDLDRFNGEFVPCLAQLYSIGRSVVIVKLLENDIREYSWRRVFDAYSEVRPELDTDLNRMATLRAYYEHVRNRSELPSERRNVDSGYVDRAIDSIEAVAAS